MKVFILCAVTLISSAIAENLQCPHNSRGQYPLCKCLNGAKYDVTYNWCASDLTELDGKCPADGPGVFPNCNCGSNKLYDKFSNACATVNRNVCPDGATGIPPKCNCADKYVFDDVHWYCRPWYLSTTPTPITTTYKPPPYVQRCGAFQYGTYPDCHWKPCPSYALNPQDFEPYCRYNYTYVDYKPCPHGFMGTPPNCYQPCPQYHYGKYPNCHRIKCKTGRGWSGVYAPDCKFTPTCPAEFPGVWPFCDIYHSKPKIVTEPNIYLPPTTKTTPRPTLPHTYLPPTTKIPFVRTTTTTRRPTTTTTTRRPITTTKTFFRTVPYTYQPPPTTRKPIVNTYLPPVRTTTKAPFIRTVPYTYPTTRQPTTTPRALPRTYLPVTTPKPFVFKTLPPFKYTYLPPNGK